MKTNRTVAGWLMLLALSTLILQPSTGFPQGTAFTYQGRLNNGANPAGGIYDLRFTIYDALGGGNAGGVLTNAATPVSNGLFTVTLDFGSGVFAGDARWLEIAVRTNGATLFTTLTPRQPVTPAPYAILAGTAGGLSGMLPVSQISGVVPLAQLPAALMTNNATGVTLSGNLFGNFGGSFFGNGGGLTGLNPANLSAGTAAINISGNAATATTAATAANLTGNVTDAQLPANVARLSGTNNFTGTNRFAGVTIATNVNNVIAGTFIGTGSGLTNLNIAQFANSVLTNSQTGVALEGAFSGSGAGLTGLNAAQLTAGTVPDAVLPASLARRNQVWLLGGNSGTVPGVDFLGTTDTSPLQFRVGGMPALRLEYTGSQPNVIGGTLANVAETYAATIGGGDVNRIGGAPFGTIGGGFFNTIQTGSSMTAIGGGYLNTVRSNAYYSVIAGGAGNSIGLDAYSSLIDGGNDNQIQDGARISIIAGGSGNMVRTNAQYSVVMGGLDNVAGAPLSLVAGNRAQAWHAGTFVWADDSGTPFGSSAPRQFLVRATGGVGINKTNPATALDVSGTVRANFFEGSGLGLTNLSATQITAGRLPVAQMPYEAILNGQTGIYLNGNFTGDGSGLVYLNADNLLSGTVPVLRLSGTYNVNISGNATTAGMANNFSGSLSGDVTGTQSATVVASLGGLTAASVAGGASAANAATNANMAGAIVKRDASGNFSAGNITLGSSLTLPETSPAADDIIYSGSSTLLLADNNLNFFVGVSAGNLAMTGPFNTGIGGSALQINMSGGYNTASGSQALYSNTSGGHNTASGSQALYNNTSGGYNTASGSQALYNNTNGGYNTANGESVLYYNTSGAYNTASGMGALHSNANGSFNTANGSQALVANTSGNNNIALGYQAGYNLTTGSSNIVIGNQGLATDTNIIRIGSGQTTAFIAGVITGNGGGLTGLDASQISSGSVADSRLSANIALLNNSQTFTGAKTFNNAANSFTGGGSGLTGLNASQLSSGSVADARLSANVPLLGSSQTFAGQNTFNGAVTLGNTLRLLDKPIYFRVGTDLAHGLGWFSSGTFAGANPDGPVLWGNGGGGLGTVSTSTNLVLIWTSNGRVGIERSPTANALEVSGNASKDVAGSWIANSDARIKTDIATVTNALDTLSQVRLVSFRYNDEYRATHPAVADRRYLNVLAQEFQKVFPEHVHGSGERLANGEEILQVDPWPLTIYSAAAVQELNRKVEQKETEIVELKARLERLEQLVIANNGGAK